MIGRDLARFNDSYVQGTVGELIRSRSMHAFCSGSMHTVDMATQSSYKARTYACVSLIISIASGPVHFIYACGLSVYIETKRHAHAYELARTYTLAMASIYIHNIHICNEKTIRVHIWAWAASHRSHHPCDQQQYTPAEY